MLNLENFADAAVDEVYDTVTIGSEVAQIRALNGREHEEYITSARRYGTYLLPLLRYGLLHPVKKTPFDVKLVEKFIADSPVAAGIIADAIFAITDKRHKEESDALEEAEKKLKGTGLSEPSGDGVTTTASPRSQQKNRVSENS